MSDNDSLLVLRMVIPSNMYIEVCNFNLMFQILSDRNGKIFLINVFCTNHKKVEGSALNTILEFVFKIRCWITNTIYALYTVLKSPNKRIIINKGESNLQNPLKLLKINNIKQFQSASKASRPKHNAEK